MKAKRQTRLHMLLSDDEARALAEICDEHDCTMSDAVRMLIRKEVASWGSEEPGVRWRDDRWRDERWPAQWPRGVPRRQVGERFHEFQARRHDARKAGLGIGYPAHDAEPGTGDHPRGEEPLDDGVREDEPRASKPRASKPRASKPRGSKPRGNKPRGSKPRGNKPRGNKPPGNKPPGNKPPGNKPRASKSQASEALPARPARRKRG